MIMHDSILPHLAQPSLMIDFLARACDVGEQGAPGGPGAGSSGTRAAAVGGLCSPGPGSRRGCAFRLGSTAARLSAGGAVSLLALNGLFILIHKHNL